MRFLHEKQYNPKSLESLSPRIPLGASLWRAPKKFFFSLSIEFYCRFLRYSFVSNCAFKAACNSTDFTVSHPQSHKRAFNNRLPAVRHFIPFIVPIHKPTLLFRQVSKIWRLIHLCINPIYSHDRVHVWRRRHCPLMLPLNRNGIAHSYHS